MKDFDDYDSIWIKLEVTCMYIGKTILNNKDYVGKHNRIG